MSLDDKLAAHRSNRLHQTIGQCSLPIVHPHPMFVDDETLVPFPPKPHFSNSLSLSLCTDRPGHRGLWHLGSIQTYKKSYELLDLTTDCQLRSLFGDDHIDIADRSFSFDDFRTFATAIEANLETLRLHAVSLNSRGMHVLSQGLPKYFHLTLLVKSIVKTVDFHDDVLIRLGSLVESHRTERFRASSRSVGPSSVVAVSLLGRLWYSWFVWPLDRWSLSTSENAGDQLEWQCLRKDGLYLYWQCTE